MTDHDEVPKGAPGKVDRKERLAEALRANLHRRKAQARNRRHNNDQKADDKADIEGNTS